MAPVASDCGSHVGLRVRTIELVDAFHAAALAAGGRAMARRGCDRSTARATTPGSSAIPTATAWKQ
jgi:hypothetical protein